MGRQLLAVVIRALKLERPGQRPPELFMAGGIVAAIDRAHAPIRELEAAHQIGKGPLALHQATAAGLHLTAETSGGLVHHVGTTLQGAQILGADGRALACIVHRTPEALIVVQSLVVNDQPVTLGFRPQHADAVGSGWVDGVRLLQQQRARIQLRQRPELHQDVGVERRVFEGLLLVAEAAAELAQQTGERRGHRRKRVRADPMGAADPYRQASASETQQPDAEIGHLSRHVRLVDHERMVGTGLEHLSTLLLDRQIACGRAALLALPGLIEDHGEAVGIVEQLAWLVRNWNGHEFGIPRKAVNARKGLNLS